VKLIDQPSKWHRLWSLRFAILAALFGALELALPLWQDVIPQTAFAALSTLCAAAAAVSRVIKQEALND
jgi:hypothetical protein